VKLGKTASDICAMLSDAYGGELQRSQVFSRKTMLNTFFNIMGTVHFEFIPQGQTVNQAYYVEILEWLHGTVPSELVLHHDKAPANKVPSVMQFLAQKSITEMEHLPYSPDLALKNFWLFQKINSALKGRIFHDIENIQKMMVLKGVPQ
jgi:hypothetical protein